MESNKTILLVEDSDKDSELIRMSLGELDISVSVERVRDGVEALEYLNAKKNPGKGIVLVLLDIKLPRMNGIEVLSQLKADETTRTIPVVMLTSSREERDVKDCYRLGANAYVVKPVDFNELFEALRFTGEFWCRVNEMPV
jgi:CheY-like chemotaxis protein